MNRRAWLDAGTKVATPTVDVTPDSDAYCPGAQDSLCLTPGSRSVPSVQVLAGGAVETKQQSTPRRGCSYVDDPYGSSMW